MHRHQCVSVKNVGVSRLITIVLVIPVAAGFLSAYPPVDRGLYLRPSTSLGAQTPEKLTRPLYQGVPQSYAGRRDAPSL